MDIRVNGNSVAGYKDAVVATDGSMLITLEKNGRSVDDILNIFAGGVKIEVIAVDGTITATYFNKAIDSVKLGTNTITVHIAVSKLEDDTADTINNRVDTSDGAIEELADMVADHEARILALEEQVAALVSASETKTETDSTETKEG